MKRDGRVRTTEHVIDRISQASVVSRRDRWRMKECEILSDYNDALLEITHRPYRPPNFYPAVHNFILTVHRRFENVLRQVEKLDFIVWLE